MRNSPLQRKNLRGPLCFLEPGCCKRSNLSLFPNARGAVAYGCRISAVPCHRCWGQLSTVSTRSGEGAPPELHVPLSSRANEGELTAGGGEGCQHRWVLADESLGWTLLHTNHEPCFSPSQWRQGFLLLFGAIWTGKPSPGPQKQKFARKMSSIVTNSSPAVLRTGWPMEPISGFIPHFLKATSFILKVWKCVTVSIRTAASFTYRKQFNIAHLLMWNSHKLSKNNLSLLRTFEKGIQGKCI